MKNQKGFTLIEMLVVLTILVIISAYVIPRISGYMSLSNDHHKRNHEYMVNKALTQYYALTGSYYYAPVLTGDEITDPEDMLTELNNKTGALIDNSDDNYKYIKKEGEDGPPNWYISKVEVQLNP